jgi:hypothetical protein
MTEVAPDLQGPSFSLQDLENAVKVIDAACSRGAFRGEEMSGVGAVRDKLVSFIVASAPKQEGGEPIIEDDGDAPVTKKPAAPKKAAKA